MLYNKVKNIDFNPLLSQKNILKSVELCLTITKVENHLELVAEITLKIQLLQMHSIALYPKNCSLDLRNPSKSSVEKCRLLKTVKSFSQ